MAKKKKGPTPPPAPVRRKPPRAPAPQAGGSRRDPQRGAAKRDAQRASAARAASRDRLRRSLITAVVVTVVLAVVAAVIVLDRRGDAELRAALTGGTCTVDTRSDPTLPSPNNHVPNPVYEVDPPAGGNHLGTGVASSGVYSGTAVPSDGLLVHSLEHGYVVVWHLPSLSQEDRDRLEDFQEAHDGDVIVVERPSLPVAVAATAWEQRLLCEQVELDALERFADTYVGKGPEDPPRT